jgi:hypothetical protein
MVGKPHRSSVLGGFGVLVAAGLLAGGCTPVPDRAPGAAVDASQSIESSTMDIPDVPSVPVPPAGAPGCALVPPAAVESTMDIELREPTESFSASGIHCNYAPIDPDGPTIIVEFRTGQDHASFVRYREENPNQGETEAEVPGVGDEAFVRTGQFDALVSNTLVARKGDVLFIVTAPVPAEKVVALAQVVLGSLL